MKKHLSTILLVAVFLLGMCILLYPTVSDYWNSLHQTRVIGAYEDTLSKMIDSLCDMSKVVNGKNQEVDAE